MKVLVIGSGAREHALIWKISQSPIIKKIYCAPGNAGISGLAECVDIRSEDISALSDFVIREGIDFTIAGPELPLVLGIVDDFKKKGLKIFGPTKAASRLESSKIFAKNIMKKYKVPTADFWVFSDYKNALDFIRKENRPLVIKADGLCAGKGVFVCSDLQEEESALKSIFQDKVFGDAGSAVLIEEMLQGEEASIIVISDGENVMPLASSQDHKRAFDADLGPNTGGMGAYSPAPVVSEKIFTRIQKEVIMPIIRGMKEEGTPYKGVLYAGVMITEKGPQTLEFNVRFGDPETQAILPRLKSDLLEIMLKVDAGKLNKSALEWDKRACVCVVIASGGYPGNYGKGKELFGLDKQNDIVVFHAGTKLKNGKIFSDGGRVLGVTGMGDTIQKAIEKTYSAVRKIKFEGMFYRSDIGKNVLNKHKFMA